MPVYVDALNRAVTLPAPPRRIVSLVPSQTELLYSLKLDEEVSGITKFCVHPSAWFKTKARVGGTKNLNLPFIRSLKPDLIIANKEENERSQVEALAADFPVYVTDVNTIADACKMISEIGAITGKTNTANDIAASVQQAFAALPKPAQVYNIAYLIWKDPYMTVGGDTFINEVLSYAGFNNVFAGANRYPQTSIEELRESNCELLLLSSEPYPFRQKHVDELQSYLPATKILLVDGELFSWYGSRLLHTPAYLVQLQQQIAAMQ